MEIRHKKLTETKEKKNNQYSFRAMHVFNIADHSFLQVVQSLDKYWPLHHHPLNTLQVPLLLRNTRLHYT